MASTIKGVKPCSDLAKHKKHDWKDENGDVWKCGGK